MQPDRCYPIGLDYAWLATDAEGHVARFTNAGQGPIPKAVLADRRASDQAEALTMALPERGDSLMLVAMPRPDDFVAVACRGLFAYDWQDAHRQAGRIHRYELISRPTVPVTVEELVGELATLIGKVKFRSIRFAESPAIAVDDHGECHSE
ncbi:hypothetical protein [Paludisphaera soli]|uniref:hypothetical protein n=1 Tax=Paludisphaera soli TaxID=2712865 RepID=UPI0013EBEA66|nr:hypothetical protein [Paludisphaera soli]